MLYLITTEEGMGFSMLGDVFTDLNNWIRGWSDATFAVVMIILVAIAFMFFINLIKGFLGFKFKFKFFSFLFLELIILIIVYLCIKH